MHPREIDLGLQRVAGVASALNIQLDCPVITVAGTNGKGSCVALLAAIMAAEGKRVGCYTSPHILHFNERIEIAGQAVDDAALCAAFARIEQCRGDTSLSYFEFATLAALLLFQAAQLDVIVLEVGLGGRLDAVNIIDADIAIISSIAMDHEAWLGDSLAAIAREKAGILRPGRPGVIGQADAPTAIASLADTRGTPLYWRDQHFSLSADALHWTWRGRDRKGQTIEYAALPLPVLALDNAATVLQALQLLDFSISRDAIEQGLRRAALPGRCQHIPVDGVDVVLDVAHNPAAVQRLFASLQEQPVSGRTAALFAVMADKAIGDILQIAAPHIDAWYLADLPDNPRAASAAHLAATLVARPGAAVRCGRAIIALLKEALATLEEGDRLLVFGSFFTVAAALQAANNRSDEGTEGQ